MFRTILLLAPLAGVLTVAAADPVSSTDLTGIYVCSGTNADGSSYQAIVEIARQNDAYQLQWVVDSEVVAVGMGIRKGDVLAVAYFSGQPGVAAYRIEPDDRLVGEWTVDDADGLLFSETLTKVSPERPGPGLPPSSPEVPSSQDHRERRQREPLDPTLKTREL
jgi:hypothetical protein